MYQKMILIIGLAALLALACGGPSALATPDMAGISSLTVMTHDSFAVREGLISDFENENNVAVTFLRSGDSGAALNRAILSKEAPMADVFYGVDNTFLSRALYADIFEPYDSPVLSKIPTVYQLDEGKRALPVDYGDVCLNYDRAYFEQHGLAVPQSLEDLIEPQYKGLLVVENPATSSPGLAFMLATVAQFGPQGYLDFWRSLRENEVVVVNDWETAYYTNFSGSSGQGSQPLVVSYSTSPAAEVYFSAEPVDESPTGAITAPGTCFRQVEFAGILQGTTRRAMAEVFVDFLLGVYFQDEMPLQMFVFPVHDEARLPDVFNRHAQAADQPAALLPADIDANRDAWIQQWEEVVLR
jgi:thiamine transport system substrate-binding protein